MKKHKEVEYLEDCWLDLQHAFITLKVRVDEAKSIPPNTKQMIGEYLEDCRTTVKDSYESMKGVFIPLLDIMLRTEDEMQKAKEANNE